MEDTAHTPEKIRNIAIIAHVDHGKTTLVDKLLLQSGSFRRGEGAVERVMDSNDLEREKGITILSKCTAITYQGYHINIVDTPGHADFGGEVERVLSMVDSVLLVVDAFEGPMPQTRFVTKKALERGLNPIVVLNKIDRPGADPDGAANGVFDLFVALDANEKQLDFPIIYASAKHGYAVRDLKEERRDLTPLFETILAKVPPPRVELDAAPAMQVATFDHDPYVGAMAIGRVESGRFVAGERYLHIRRDGARHAFKAAKILGFRGLHRLEMPAAIAGDIVAITGMEDLQVGETLTSITEPRVLPLMAVDEPTVTMTFLTNSSPFAGTEGKYVTSRHLRERLEREIKSNVSLRVAPTDSPDAFTVSGRGELHLAVLIETMRREGFELLVSQPQVVTREGPEGVTEPHEYVVADVESQHAGIVIDALNRRGGRMQDLREQGAGRSRIEFIVPTRGLIGYRPLFLTDTRGTGILSHVFHEYGPWSGEMRGRQSGVLVVDEPCTTVTYALWKLQDRGLFFVNPGERVYAGQVIGLHTRENDLIINPGREKKLTNIRAAGADEKNILTPARILTLEEALEFINDDEYVEVTPKSIRLRKRILDHNLRRQSEKRRSLAAEAQA